MGGSGADRRKPCAGRRTWRDRAAAARGWAAHGAGRGEPARLVEGRGCRARGHGYRRGLPHLQCIARGGPPRCSGIAAARLGEPHRTGRCWHAPCLYNAQKGGGSVMAADGSAAFGIVGIGHNGGPPLDRRAGWRQFCWKKAHARAWETPPREITLARLPRAEAPRIALPQYTAILLGPGGDLL